MMTVLQNFTIRIKNYVGKKFRYEFFGVGGGVL